MGQIMSKRNVETVDIASGAIPIPTPPVSRESGVYPKEIETARDYLIACGLEPTPDAIEQLAYAFVPALTIMCKRGYNPQGDTWREGGWRGLVYELRKKMDRIWHRSWLGSEFDDDSPLDMINYAGMYFRQECRGLPWGVKGEPGSVEHLDRIAMGDYSEVRQPTSP